MLAKVRETRLQIWYKNFLFHSAYVCGEVKGLVLEKAFLIGETLRKTCSKLDIKLENKLVADKLYELQKQEASEETISTTMKDFGIERFLSD